MAKHKITLEEMVSQERIGNSMSTSYSFNGSELTIHWERENKTIPAKVGESYIVDCGGGMPNVYKFQYPKNPFKLFRMEFGWMNPYKNEAEMLQEIVWAKENYAERYPYSQGLFYKGEDYIPRKFEYAEYYQAEGVVEKFLLLSEDLSLKEFKYTMAKILGEEAVARIPEKGLFWDYANKFENN